VSQDTYKHVWDQIIQLFTLSSELLLLAPFRERCFWIWSHKTIPSQQQFSLFNF